MRIEFLDWRGNIKTMKKFAKIHFITTEAIKYVTSPALAIILIWSASSYGLSERPPEPTIWSCAYHLAARGLGLSVPLRWQSPSYFLADFPDILIKLHQASSENERLTIKQEASFADLHQILNYLASDLPYQIANPNEEAFLRARFYRPTRSRSTNAHIAVHTGLNFLYSLDILISYDRKHETEYYLQGMWSVLEKHPNPLTIDLFYFQHLVTKSATSKDPNSIRKLVEESLNYEWRTAFGRLPDMKELIKIFASIQAKVQNEPDNGAMTQFVNLILAELKKQIREDLAWRSLHEASYRTIRQYAYSYFISVRAPLISNHYINQDPTIDYDLINAFDHRVTPHELKNFIQSDEVNGTASWSTVTLNFKKSQRSIENQQGLALEFLNPEALTQADLMAMLKSILPQLSDSGAHFFLITPRNPEVAEALEQKFGFKSLGISLQNPKPLFLRISGEE